jgi:ABC-type branched-subunit amino acid transport system ATPase component
LQGDPWNASRLIDVPNRQCLVEKGRVVWSGISQQLDVDRALR